MKNLLDNLRSWWLAKKLRRTLEFLKKRKTHPTFVLCSSEVLAELYATVQIQGRKVLLPQTSEIFHKLLPDIDQTDVTIFVNRAQCVGWRFDKPAHAVALDVGFAEARQLVARIRSDCLLFTSIEGRVTPSSAKDIFFFSEEVGHSALLGLSLSQLINPAGPYTSTIVLAVLCFDALLRLAMHFERQAKDVSILVLLFRFLQSIFAVLMGQPLIASLIAVAVTYDMRRKFQEKSVLPL